MRITAEMAHGKGSCMMKVVGVFLLALALVVAGATSAQAGLTEAHQQALAVYKKTKDPTKAIKILEDAGIKGVLEQKPADMKRDAYVRLLNDYGFYLSEAADTSAGRGVAIDLLEKVIQLSPDRAVAYLNLG